MLLSDIYWIFVLQAHSGSPGVTIVSGTQRTFSADHVFVTCQGHNGHVPDELERLLWFFRAAWSGLNSLLPQLNLSRTFPRLDL